MINPDQAQELSDYCLCEELENRLEVLSLCIEAINTNHTGTGGLFTAFDEVDTLAREIGNRLSENTN
jgi:hypothetical protein